MRRRLSLFLGLLLLLALTAVAACSQGPPAPPSGSTAKQATATPEDDDDCNGESFAKCGSSPTQTPRPLPTSAVAGFQTEVIAEGVILPQSLAFAPDGRLFFVEVKS